MGIDSNVPEQQELLDRDRKHKAKNDAHINQINVKQIQSVYNELKESIATMQKKTSIELLQQRSDIW